MARQHDFDLTGYIQLIANDKQAPRSLVREAAIALRHGKVQNKSSSGQGSPSNMTAKTDGISKKRLASALIKTLGRLLAAWLDAVGDKWNSKADAISFGVLGLLKRRIFWSRF